MSQSGMAEFFRGCARDLESVQGWVIYLLELEGKPVAFDVGVSPSPMSGQATIRYTIDEPAHIELDVFDVTGRQVQRLMAGPVEAGVHHVVWDGQRQDGQRIASGTYFIRASIGPRTFWQRLVLVR